MIKNAIQFINRNDLLRHNVVFFAGSLFIAVFNYLYYPVIGRLVPVRDFGEIQALISIFMQLGIILTTFGYVVTNIINNTKDHKKSEDLIVKLEQLTLLACIVIFIALSFSSFVLKNSLQLTSAVPLVLVGFLVALNVPSTSRTYFLQGLRQLKEVSIAGIIFAAGKLVVSVVLILLGYGVLAVMIGYIVAQTATLLYLLVKTKKIFPGLRSSFTFVRKQQANRGAVKDEVIYGIAILVLLSGITLLYSSDSIVIRLFFSPAMAGMYSGVSSVARIVFFITASVSGVLLATVKMEDGRRENVRILAKSFGIVTLVGGAAMIFFMLFPVFSISVLFGSKYVGAAHLLPLMSLVMLLCSYNNLLVCYEIALRRFKAIIIVIASVTILTIAVYLFHASLTYIILGYLVSNLVVLVLLSIHILKRKDHAEATVVSRSA